jgi:peroxiredoxin
MSRTQALTSKSGGIVLTIAIGDSLPHVTLKSLTPEGMRDIDVHALCAHGRSVIFSLPGAFTPQCSARHLPGFLEHAADFAAKGVARLICVSVNDAFVMDAWARHNHVDGRIHMLADGNGDFTQALGLSMDARPFGMGVRSQRFALVVADGRVTQLFVEEPGAFEVSAASYVLSRL